MTLRSMTGYGHGVAVGDGFRVEVELSTVNRRQLDIQVILPRALASLESVVHARLHARLARGRVTGEFRLEYREPRLADTVQVNEALAERYIRTLRRTAKRLGLEDTIDARWLLQLPDVVSPRRPEIPRDLLGKAVREALDRALEAVDRMRRAEGRLLTEDLRAILQRVETLLKNELAPLAPRAADDYRRLLHARLRAARLPIEEDDNRLLKEIALFAVRADISEEITRLQSHIRQARGFLRSREPAGRRLDFLAQEMFREINTIGAKAHHAGIQRGVVAVKADLERWREQAQNIE